ncbi:glycoside hydrolase family 128 protein [Athelia psychrophila]|uniref:Glycoside hydrolase family 128 protein n=1 Tax=Athelia psychrophila TaxID=1759441 RepID=A0A166RKW7_9AGAM|nr:glycoside hydrolase family 128 protein [Fibularhizoctonia sp. CBS 109695]
MFSLTLRLFTIILALVWTVSAVPITPELSPTVAYPVAKVGLAWANGDNPSLANFKTPQVSMLYTWSPTFPSNAAALGFHPVPMLWGEAQVTTFTQLVVKGYSDTVLGFNEPNEPGQSNLTPASAAALWQQYIQPLKNEGYALISPATSSDPNGLPWMQAFLAECGSTCTFDGMAAHYYDVTSAGLIAYINLWYTTFGKPIWLTEFACQNFNGGLQCTQTEVYEFMYAVTEYMDNTSWVARYCAFGVMTDMQGVNVYNQLMAADGWPTSLGENYINA